MKKRKILALVLGGVLGLVLLAVAQQLHPAYPIQGLFMWSQLTTTNAPTDGQTMIWRASTQTWEPTNASSAASSLTNGTATITALTGATNGFSFATSTNSVIFGPTNAVQLTSGQSVTYLYGK